MWKPVLGKTLDAAKVVDAECRLEDHFATHIKENASAVGATILFAESEQQVLESSHQLFVTIDDVANVGVGMRPTPITVMTFTARIVIDGIERARVQRDLQSSVLGNCSRLEKLAKTAGKFVAEWVARRAPRVSESGQGTE